MSEKGRIVLSGTGVDAEVPRQKCCWVAFLSLCLLTVNSIVCIHLARRLAYVEGQLAKQTVSSGKETTTEVRFGYQTDTDMSGGVTGYPGTVAGINMKQNRLYDGPKLPPRKHQNRKKRSAPILKPLMDDLKNARVRIRLSGGQKQNEGRVELRAIGIGGVWGTVCSKGWDIHAANVLCRQLGLQRAVPITVDFGPGSGPVWLSDVSCTGNESIILECPQSKFGDNDCDHDDDVGVICDGPLADWTKHGSSYYKFLQSTFATYTKARALCEAEDSKIAMPKDQAAHDSIVQYRNMFYTDINIWIGLNDMKVEGDFVWEDGTPLGNLSRWLPGQPNNGHGLQHCTVLTPETNRHPNQWRDDVCSATWGVICEKVSECNSSPCQNEGTCIDGVDHYICKCGRGWVGVHCEKPAKASSSLMDGASRNWAHIEAQSDSTGGTHTVRRHDSVLTKHWEQFEPSDKFRFHSGVLTVFEEGDYYIYSQVYYLYNSKKSAVTSHSVMVVENDQDNPYRFLTCWKYMEETVPWNTCFTAGVIHLFPNNSVYLHMPCDGCVIKLDHDATFFGVMKLSDAKGQHRNLHRNLHPPEMASSKRVLFRRRHSRPSRQANHCPSC
ncbi:uncharacterized protein LOC144873741 isoform X1 [Branchiostoma floridae x Branchiostoma japonicum]